MENIFKAMDSCIKQLDGVLERLHNHTEENMAINIIIDDSDPPNPILVEIENDAGESIRIGEELKTDEGYRKLRINTADIIRHEKT